MDGPDTEKELKRPKKVPFDSVYEAVGPFGIYQVALFFTAIFGSFWGAEVIYMNFVGYEPNHWCSVPELSNLSFSQQKYIAIPSKDGGYDDCHEYALNYTEYSMGDFLTWNRTLAAEYGVRTCHRWVYDRSVVRSSIVTKWNLVCGKDFLVELVSTVYLAGVLVSALPLGIMADKFGRKFALLVVLFFKIVGGFGSAFAPNYVLLCLSRFILGVGSNGAYVIPLILMLELVGPSYRSLVGVGFALTYSFGFMTVGAVGYFVRDDVLVQIVMVAPNLLLFVIYCYLPESPRWLLVRGQHEKADTILRKIALINGNHLPEDFDVRNIQVDVHEKSKKNMLDIIKHPVLRLRFLILALHWFTDSLVYYALSLNTATLSGNVYTNTVLAGAVEVPANILAIFALNWRRLGRRLTASLSLVVAGIGCLVCVPLILENAPGGIVTGLSLFGKAGVTIGFSAMYVYTSELFPTDVRNISIGGCSVFARISGMMAPFVGGPLGDVWPPLPSLVFGVFSLAAGGFALLLPETLGTPLLDSIDQLPSSRHRDKTSRIQGYVDETNSIFTVRQAMDKHATPDCDSGTIETEKNSGGSTPDTAASEITNTSLEVLGANM